MAGMTEAAEASSGPLSPQERRAKIFEWITSANMTINPRDTQVARAKSLKGEYVTGEKRYRVTVLDFEMEANA